MSTRWLTLYQRRRPKKLENKVLDLSAKALVDMVSITLKEADAEKLNDTLVNV